MYPPRSHANEAENILTVHDIGTHEGSPYIVAELLEGQELRDRLGEGVVFLIYAEIR